MSEQRLREIFLKDHWNPYPGWDDQFLSHRVGRVLDISFAVNSDDDVSIRLTTNLSEHLVSARKGELSWDGGFLLVPDRSINSLIPVEDVIEVGDWLAVSPKKDVVLLAPGKSSDMLRTQERYEIAKRWSTYLEKIRSYFQERSFVEMATPALVLAPGTEPFLDPLEVEINYNGNREKRFFITSPEFHLKKHLGDGFERIFEITKCYRNKESGPTHRTEFYMLEWYRAFANLNSIADDVEKIVQIFSPDTRLVRTTVAELFQNFLSFQLTSHSTRSDLAKLAASKDVRVLADDSFDDIFNKLFLEFIEPHLESYGKGFPVLISQYPPSQAALARIDSMGFADRFEVFWRGFEICNAFHELNDPAENRRRFERDNVLRRANGRKEVPQDEELLKSFAGGVPPSAGIALGLERLLMAILQKNDIAEVRTFST